VFAQRSKGGADVPHGSPGTARSPRMSHVSSTESMVSNPSDSSLASTASVSPRAAGRGTMPAVSSGDLRLLFQEIDNKYEATKQPREGKTDADADWESALSELERMGATDQILALDVSASVCVALAMNPSTESASSATATTVACRTSRSLCSIVLENIHARVVQRLKYVQLAATVGGLSMYNDMHPGAPSKIMTTNSAEQFREHSRDSAPRDFLSFSFEQPRLAPSKRSQLQVCTARTKQMPAVRCFACHLFLIGVLMLMLLCLECSSPSNQEVSLRHSHFDMMLKRKRPRMLAKAKLITRPYHVQHRSNYPEVAPVLGCLKKEADWTLAMLMRWSMNLTTPAPAPTVASVILALQLSPTMPCGKLCKLCAWAVGATKKLETTGALSRSHVSCG